MLFENIISYCTLFAKEQKDFHLNSIGVAAKLKIIVVAALHRSPNIAIATPQRITVVPEERDQLLFPFIYAHQHKDGKFYSIRHENSCTSLANNTELEKYMQHRDYYPRFFNHF